MNNRWKYSNTTVYNLGYHLIWTTKYRRDVLTDEVSDRMKVLLNEKAVEMGCEIENMEFMPDHVHLFVKAKPTLPPHFIVQQFKGYTSRVLRGEFKELRSRIPSLWTRSYYVESVGNISEESIKKYIDNQKNA